MVGVAIVGLLYEALVAQAPDRSIHLAIGSGGCSPPPSPALLLWDWDGDPVVLGGSVSADKFAVVACMILLVVAAFGLVYGTHYFCRDPAAAKGEYYPLVLFATAGMTLIAAAADLIVMFLALEILSLSLYVLTGITGSRRANEAAMKYFLLGAFASAFFLYGVAMAYGAVDTTNIVQIVRAMSGQTGNQALALLSFAFLAIGFGFKVSAAPFHMWTPDVYQGAPTPVTAYMSAATKVAAFAALIRVLMVAFQPLTWDWQPVDLGAGRTLDRGRLGAGDRPDRHQAHAGVLLGGAGRVHPDGPRVGHGRWDPLGALLPGGVLGHDPGGVRGGDAGLGQGRGADLDHVLRGPVEAQPVAGGLMAIFMLSLAGIPPTAGFIAKVGVFASAIGAGAGRSR